MSVEALAIVLHHSRARGTAKLVLLGIANHQGDGGAWPSVATLATYANVNERNTQQAIAKLRGMGELEVDVQAGGLAAFDDYTRPNLYRVLVACPPWCDRTMSHRDTRKRSGRQTALPVAGPVDKSRPDRVSHSTPGVASDRGGGVASDTQTVTTNQPTQVPASTTDRTRPERPGCEPGCTLDSSDHHGVCRLPAPAPAPVDELARVRAQLAADTAAIRAREH